MKITRATVDFWRQHKLPSPKWATAVEEKAHRVSIDGVINSQAGIRPKDFELDAINLMNIIRMHMRNVERHIGRAPKGSESVSTMHRRRMLLEYLEQLGRNPGTVIRPNKRAAYARKWAQRLQRQWEEEKRGI